MGPAGACQLATSANADVKTWRLPERWENRAPWGSKQTLTANTLAELAWGSEEALGALLQQRPRVAWTPLLRSTRTPLFPQKFQGT